ncbi:MAG: hypothetical protein ACOYOE_04935 [Chlorobium sp.]
MSQTKGVKLNDTTQQRLAALARILPESLVLARSTVVVVHWRNCTACSELTL